MQMLIIVQFSGKYIFIVNLAWVNQSRNCMKYLVILILAAGIPWHSAYSQNDTIAFVKKTEVMIPMRDGIRLHTVILTPVDAKAPMPILLQRTPYGAFPTNIANDSAIRVGWFGPNYTPFAKDGYCLVFQDIRGKYQSEGMMQIHQPLVHASDKNAVDESTDTWDTIDWLTRNVSNNNGKAGIFGVSYPGWLALVGAVDPHPALKAASEQACMGDLFLGDDFHHNGAFRLSYGMEYTYEVEWDKTTDSDFPFPQYDLFDWYLSLGSLKNVNDRYFHEKVPTWNNFVKHPNYDSFWQKNSPLSYVSRAQIPQLHVGGYYDQEDMNGPQLMYEHMEKNDRNNYNFIVLGPWNHGQWSRGNDRFSVDFRLLQKKWFDYWLRGIGDGKFAEATCVQTGSNQWKTYSSWPPREAEVRKLYAGPNRSASFSRPTSSKGYVSYVSDPSRPVPYRSLPIEATYGPGSRWRNWQIEDQRFVYTRPDVVSFVLDTLTEDLVVTGKVRAHLFASTSGTDADWVVKLIDVYPAFNKDPLNMSGFQFPVAMEVFRGRFRKSFVEPSPLVPNKPEEFVIDLHDIDHVFRKGHRIMIQVQSSWFPVIDRNPQKYVRNIFEARESDFIKAEQRIYFNAAYPTYIELPVMAN
jgi:putative CocE/NonD family hydrolase